VAQLSLHSYIDFIYVVGRWWK